MLVNGLYVWSNAYISICYRFKFLDVNCCEAIMYPVQKWYCIGRKRIPYCTAGVLSAFIWCWTIRVVDPTSSNDVHAPITPPAGSGRTSVKIIIKFQRLCSFQEILQHKSSFIKEETPNLWLITYFMHFLFNARIMFMWLPLNMCRINVSFKKPKKKKKLWSIIPFPCYIWFSVKLAAHLGVKTIGIHPMLHYISIRKKHFLQSQTFRFQFFKALCFCINIKCWHSTLVSFNDNSCLNNNHGSIPENTNLGIALLFALSKAEKN